MEWTAELNQRWAESWGLFGVATLSLLVAIFSFAGTAFSISAKKKRKRELLLNLSEDEIEKRWRERILPTFDFFVSGEYNYIKSKNLYRASFDKRDLPVFTYLSDNIMDYGFLKNDKLISIILYASVKIKDISDIIETHNSNYKERLQYYNIFSDVEEFSFKNNSKDEYFEGMLSTDFLNLQKEIKELDRVFDEFSRTAKKAGFDLVIPE